MTITAPQTTASRRTPDRGAARRRRWLGLTIVPVLALTAACQAPRPDVTFYGNGASADTEPTKWCPIDTAALTIGDCEEAATDEIPRLQLQPGQSVQINVPTKIAEQPWGVYFRYLTPDGELADGRTSIFDDRRLAYTLRPLDAGDQLTVVEVQSGFVPTAQDEFQATQVWQLLIDPEQRSDQTSPDFDTEDTAGTN